MFEVVKDLTSFAEVVWEQGEDILVDNVEGVVGKPDSTDSRVPGRILGCQEVYGLCGADPYILSVVEKGYFLEFDEVPPPSFTKNNKSALRHASCTRSCKDWSGWVAL